METTTASSSSPGVLGEDRAIQLFAALALPTRLQVFRLLIAEAPGSLPAGEIARRLETPANTMSTHLATLERAGLVNAERQGRSILYRADLATVRGLLVYLLQDCCQGRPEVCTPLAALLNDCAAGC